MNKKDLYRTRIHIDVDGKDIFLAVDDAKKEPIADLQRPINGEFIQVMTHYLIKQSGNGEKPVVIYRGGIPIFEVTIKMIEVVEEKSLIAKPV